MIINYNLYYLLIIFIILTLIIVNILEMGFQDIQFIKNKYYANDQDSINHK